MNYMVFNPMWMFYIYIYASLIFFFFKIKLDKKIFLKLNTWPNIGRFYFYFFFVNLK